MKKELSKVYKVPLYKIIGLKDVSDLFGEKLIAFVEPIDDIIVVKRKFSCRELYTKFKLCVGDGNVSTTTDSHLYISLPRSFVIEDERTYYVVLDKDMDINHMVDSYDIALHNHVDSKWYEVYLDSLKKYSSDEKKRVKKVAKNNYGIFR